MIENFANKQPKITSSTFIHKLAYVNGEVVIGENVSIFPFASIRGDVREIHIKDNTNIQDNCVLHTSENFPLNIGENVTVGHNAILHGCTIGDNVLIGMGTIVLDGVTIETNVMLGAGSLVPPNKHLETGFLYLGSPVKQIRKLTTEEINHIQTNANHYVEIGTQMLQQNKENKN